MLGALSRRFLSLVAHRLAFLVPRSEDVWAFGSRGGERFAGNAKYLFLHVAHCDDLDARPVWISDSRETVGRLRARGYEARRADTLSGLWTLLRAEYVCLTGSFTDVPTWPTGGATVVQLWHGIPLKRIGRSTLTDGALSLVDRLATRYLYRQFDRVVVTGERLTGLFSAAFGVDSNRIAVTGYPRNDAMFREIPGFDVGQDRTMYEAVAALEGRVLAYLPTYRDEGRSPASAVDFAALDDFLAAHDATMLVKFHPFEEHPEADYENVWFLPPEFDVYPALRHVDALVTDYSSVYFDYLLLDRPVVFYAYDLADYRSGRGFALDFESYTPGPVVTDFDDLLDALAHCLDDPDRHADDRERVVTELFDHHDGHAAERVVTELTTEPTGDAGQHTGTSRPARTGPAPAALLGGVPGIVRGVYDRFVRPSLPSKIGLFNTVASRRVKLFDATDEFPQYEEALLDAIRATVEPGDRVVVVGGGWGVSSVVAARHAGPDGQVTAYEPARDRYEHIRETAALNGVADRVHARRRLVGPAVKVDGDGTGAGRVTPAELPECDVLVLDCEGAEADVLADVTATPRVVVVETHGCFGTPEAETREVLRDRGYEVRERTSAHEPERDLSVLTAVRVDE